MNSEIPLKAWEIFQDLARGLGDTCWKIRSIFYTAASALLAYAFVHSVPALYGVVAGLSVAFFVLESGYKQIQDQFIRKSVEVERTINDILVDETEPFISEDGIYTSINPPTLSRCFRFPGNRIFFWGPYAIMFGLSLLMLSAGIVDRKTPRLKTPVTAVFADSSVSDKDATAWKRELKRVADALSELQSKLSGDIYLVNPSPTPIPSSQVMPTRTPESPQ